jgi:2-polyprenyl-3-methyl-5-hydroxy-6-metoxy-1,4-benzoquinol methylase
MNNRNKFDQRCPVCNSKNTKVILKKNQLINMSTKYFKPTNASFEKLEVAFCYDCTMIFVTTNVVNIKENLSGEVYNTALTTISDDEKSAEYHTIEILKKYSNKGKLLEIGSGRGEFLHLLESNGFDVSGCEPGSAYFISRDKYSFEVKHNIFEVNDYTMNDYDVVVFQNCLEHIPNPKKVIKGIWSILKENGILFIQIPNFEFSISNNIYSDVFFEHVLYFNWNNLELFLNNNNFQVLHHETLNEERDQIIIAKKVLGDISYNRLSNEKINDYTNKVTLFAKGFNEQGNKVDNFIKTINQTGRKIIIYGAGITVLSNFSLTENGLFFLKNRIDFLVDGDENKHGYYIPFVPVPINSPKILTQITNPKDFCILICAEKYTDEIYKNIALMLGEKVEDVLIYSIFPNFNQITKQNRRRSNV